MAAALLGDHDEVFTHLRDGGGESHFDEIDIPVTRRGGDPRRNAVRAFRPLPGITYPLHAHPRGDAQVGYHTVPERVLTVRLDGSVQCETSDGEVRQVQAGSFVLVEDTHGKGHISRHSAEAQTVIWITLPNGLDPPLL